VKVRSALIQKTRAYNVDEIDAWLALKGISPRFCSTLDNELAVFGLEKKIG